MQVDQNIFPPDRPIGTFPPRVDANAEMAPDGPFFQVILDAIAETRNVEILYDDDVLARTISIHVLRETKNGNLCIEGIQIADPGKPENDGQWRNFNLSKLKSIVLVDSVFVPDPAFDPSGVRYRNGTIATVAIRSRGDIR